MAKLPYASASGILKYVSSTRDRCLQCMCYRHETRCLKWSYTEGERAAKMEDFLGIWFGEVYLSGNKGKGGGLNYFNLTVCYISGRGDQKTSGLKKGFTADCKGAASSTVLRQTSRRIGWKLGGSSQRENALS